MAIEPQSPRHPKPMKRTWRQKMASDMSRWQFRKLIRYQRQQLHRSQCYEAKVGLHDQLQVIQVKSLEIPPIEFARASGFMGGASGAVEGSIHGGGQSHLAAEQHECNWEEYFDTLHVDRATQTTPRPAATTTSTQVQIDDALHLGGPSTVLGGACWSGSWEPLTQQVRPIGRCVRVSCGVDKAGWPTLGEPGVVIGARGAACRVMLDRCAPESAVWPKSIFQAWIPKPDIFWGPLVTRMLFSAETVSTATQSEPAYEHHGNAMVQTPTGWEQGGCETTSTHRVTREDEIINQYHCGALYTERWITALERRLDGDVPEVKGIREEFEEWDARMCIFRPVDQRDVSIQATSRL